MPRMDGDNVQGLQFNSSLPALLISLARALFIFENLLVVMVVVVVVLVVHFTHVLLRVVVSLQ